MCGAKHTSLIPVYLGTRCPKFGQIFRSVVGVNNPEKGYSQPMNLVRDLQLQSNEGKSIVQMVVETPAGSGVKLKYDEERGVFLWSRPLVTGVQFPFDFGFLPQTLADDGDALDALLLTDQGSYPGVVVPSRVIGALKVKQFRDGQPVKRNDRIMLLPVNDHRLQHITEMAQMGRRISEEIEAFFCASLSLTG